MSWPPTRLATVAAGSAAWPDTELANMRHLQQYARLVILALILGDMCDF